MKLRDVVGRLYIMDIDAPSCQFPRARAALVLPVLSGQPIEHSPVLNLPVPITADD